MEPSRRVQRFVKEIDQHHDDIHGGFWAYPFSSGDLEGIKVRKKTSLLLMDWIVSYDDIQHFLGSPEDLAQAIMAEMNKAWIAKFN